MRIVLWAILALVVLLFVLVGLTALRLYYAPISVNTFLTQIEDIADRSLPDGQTLAIDDALVSFAEGGGLALRLSGVSLREDDNMLLSAPRIDLEVGLLALLRETIVPKEIVIPRMTAHVRREQNGRFLIAGQDPGEIGETMGPPVRSQAVFYDPDEPEFVSFIYSMRRAIQPLADDDLSRRPPRILIQDTEIIFEDELEARTRRFHNVAFAYNPTGDADNLWRIDFAADGQKGRLGFAMAEFPLSGESETIDGRSIEFRFEDVSLADFAPGLADRSQNFQFSAPFSGGARLDFDLKGELVDLKSVLEIGAGEVQFDVNEVALLDEASFRFDWEPDIRALSLRKGSVHFGETGGEFRGVAVWPEKRNGNVRIAIEGTDLKLAARDNPLPPKLLKQLVFHAKVGRESGIATIERFSMDADEGSVNGSGSFAMVDGELTAGMTFVISAMPYEFLTHIWPINIANGARKWVIENVKAGSMTGGTIEMNLTESMLERQENNRLILPDDSLLIQFGARNIALKGFGDLPPAFDVDGTGVITGRTFIANITDGHFLTEAGREFAINSGKFEIPDHSEKPPTGVVVLDGTGSAAALGEIADSEPLAVLRNEKQKATDLSGTAQARVRVSFPFLKDVKKEQVDYSARIALKNFKSRSKIRGFEVSKADLKINTDGSAIDIDGKARVDGLDTSLDLSTSTDGSVPSTSRIDLVLDDEDRKRLGLELDPWLRGAVKVRVEQGGKKPDTMRISADLTRAVIDLDEIGWSKKVNVRGQATFELTEKGKLYEVRSASISGDGFEASAKADIHKDEGLKSLTVSKLHLSRGDRLKLSVVQSKKDFYTLKITGDLLDLRGSLQSSAIGSGTGNSDSSPANDSYVVNANIKKIIGLSGHSLSNFVGSLHVIRGKNHALKARGLIDGRASLSVDTKQNDVPTVHVSTEDAGALFRFLGAVDQVLGGRLTMSVRLQDGWKNVQGSVHLKEFKLGGQVEKQERRRNSIEQVNSDFDKLTLHFAGANGRYEVTDGIIKGPALGATMMGWVDLRVRKLNMFGTYIPVYGLNSLFSKLPIIGRVVGGRKNEGLLGITYKIKGNMSNPKIFINPASLLAPGLFRRIFEFR